MARELFPGKSDDLPPALTGRALYAHRETAIRGTHIDGRNIVVATGAGSGKTESFLYPILFELYRQHLAGGLDEPGVRALILYPMNALANDQRQRLGEICEALDEAGSGFKPTFGQYIGQTPENRRDRRRNAAAREAESLPGEIVFRDEMRAEPPHIPLTNYSMLEYLPIRPDDSPLFDGGRSVRWQFLVLDEAHQYRGAKGIEMGMLLRRLKQRLCEGGRRDAFRCIATSATLSDGESEEDRKTVADFATELFGEPFSTKGVVFGTMRPPDPEATPKRYHAFLRALEGAFLVHRDGKDGVALNRTRRESEDGSDSEPLEIALCRECGQHYYVGQTPDAKLIEAVRDPSQPRFGVEYYMPAEDGDRMLCRRCGTISNGATGCSCGAAAAIAVKLCESHKDRPDQLKECAACGYSRGGVGDPVQEIVHGSDGPNAVIATALHELLDEDCRRVLAFADSRQEAAFFAWYAQRGYEEVRDRNLILRAVAVGEVATEGLSIDDLGNRLLRQWDRAGLFGEAETDTARRRKVLAAILREAITEERRLSLSGVGLIEWSVMLPNGFRTPDAMRRTPWNFTEGEARCLVAYLLDDLRARRAMNLPEYADAPGWTDVSPWPQQAYRLGSPGRQKHVRQWGGSQTVAVGHFLPRLLADNRLSGEDRRKAVIALMEEIWRALPKAGKDSPLSPGNPNGTFRLNPHWLRISPADPNNLWECKTCATLTVHNIRGVCPRNGCPGALRRVDLHRLEDNHYRRLYENIGLPSMLRAEEHTAQIDSERAPGLQDEFKAGRIHLLSSSTTFEVGVDLGDGRTAIRRRRLTGRSM